MRALTGVVSTTMIETRWFPELLLLPDRATQKKVYARALRRSFQPLQGRVFLLVGLCVLGVAEGILVYGFRSLGDAWGLREDTQNALIPLAFLVLAPGIAIGTFRGLYPWLARDSIRKALWVELSECGCAICASCG